DAGHGPVEVAIAGEMPFLVGGRPGTAVGKIDRVEKRRELEREVLVQGSAGQVSRLKRGFHRVALEAHPQRLVLGECRQRPHADVRLVTDLSGAGELDVASAWPVTRLAIHGEGGEPGLVAPRGGVKL